MKCNKRMITDDMGKPNIVISWSLLAESIQCNKRMITDDMGKPNIVISWSLLAESIHKQRMNMSSKTSVRLMSWCLLAERGMSSKNEHVIENMSSIDNEMFPMLQVCSRYPGYISDTPGMSLI